MLSHPYFLILQRTCGPLEGWLWLWGQGLGPFSPHEPGWRSATPQPQLPSRIPSPRSSGPHLAFTKATTEGLVPFPEFQRAVLALTGDLELTSWWLFSVTNRKEGAQFPSRELLQGETPGMKR